MSIFLIRCELVSVIRRFDNSSRIHGLPVADTFDERHSMIRGDDWGGVAVMKLDAGDKKWFPVYFICVHRKDIEWE